ncbi:TonB-linked SusC/RagA family outer membrane protein [Arcticibacter tournemirensis]|nr:TonB-linked SusC/RagA family outer membrane protein [Arcticibacter tournemirensis]
MPGFGRLLPYKLFLVMKLTAILLTITCLQLSANSFSQSISLSGKNLPLEKVLTAIEKQSGYFFFYKYNELKSAKPVTVDLDNVSVAQALEQSFKGQPFKYVIEERTIIVTKKNEKEPVKITPLITVRGKVTDDKGEPLPGATIRVKGSNQATVSDINGVFNIANVEDNAVLVITYTGFAQQEISVNGRAEISISLKEDLQALSEVVVVGYGTQKKVNVTGAVSSIKGEDIQNRPVRNVTSALQGQMAGVTIVSSTAVPGNNSTSIRIRGEGTLNDANPLVVIDGVPGGNMNILNPDDIESVSVLKDAASSSIYGVRGGNGVILVTTKKGAGDQPNIGYSNYFGFQTPTALPKRIGSVEYMTMLNEARSNVGQNPTYTDAQIEIARNGSDPNYYANTDWIDAIMKKSAPQQNHNFSINGGAKNLNYYLSYGFLKEGGLVTGDKYQSKRHNIRARFNTSLFNRLDLDANIGYIDRNYAGSSEDVTSATGPIYAAMQILPLVPVRFTTGGWGYIGGSRNPVAVTTDGGSNDFGSQEVTANLQAKLNITKGLNLRSQYALIRSNSKRTVFNKTINYYSPDDGSLIYQTSPTNSITANDYTNFYQSFLGLAEYERTFAEKNELKLMVAYSREEEITDNFNASRLSLPSQDVPSLNIGTLQQENGASSTQWALQSIFGRLNYIYNKKYLAEGNFRYDGSSRFRKDLRWDWFFSGSLGWIFSEEGFFEPLKSVIDFGKIRASYGSQGNDRVTSSSGGTLNFGYLATISPFQTMPIGNVPQIGYRQNGVANELLRWESSTKQDFGIDLTMLRSRLGITADYYINKTNDILLPVRLPDVLGVGENYPPQNAGKVENKGWELLLSWKDRIKKVNYGLSVNLSDVRNEVTDMGGSNSSPADRVQMVGYPIDAFYGFVADRLAQEADFDYNPATRVYTPRFAYDTQYPPKPGDIILKDLDGDGAITSANDRKVIGSAIPRYTYGFRGNVDWKGIDFQFFLQGVGKAEGLITGSARHAFINEGSMPQSVHLDRWTIDNPDASYPRLTYNQSYNQRLSTYWLEDASYLRLKNIQVGYTFPSSLVQKFRISRLRVYASADNLFTKSDYYYGYDPESPVTSGGYYPQVKTFVFGLNVNLK